MHKRIRISYMGTFKAQIAVNSIRNVLCNATLGRFSMQASRTSKFIPTDS
jgi:hypothetical protein